MYYGQWILVLKYYLENVCTSLSVASAGTNSTNIVGFKI